MSAMFGPCYVMQPAKMRRNQHHRDYFCCGKTVLHLALTWSLLLTLAVFKKAAIVDGALQGTTCARFVGQYRDCMCSVKYRDVEERCCDRYTCFQPILRSENFTCPMECQNGGTRIAGSRPCLCRSGYHGLCCQKGTTELIPYIRLKYFTQQIFEGTIGLVELFLQCNFNTNPKISARVAHISVKENFQLSKISESKLEIGKDFGTMFISICVLFFSPETFRCGGNFVAPMGEFKSPRFPRSYPNSIRCVWKISTDRYRRIALGVKNGAFDVEQGSSIYSCNHDWVSVYDGETKARRRLGTFCGNGMRTFQTLHSTGRHLYIEFKSDWQQQRSGFQLQYVTFLECESWIHTAVTLMPS